MSKQLALFTMVYDDDVYLDIFLRYWTRFLPRENIFVLMHANYDRYEALAKGCNTLRINRPAVHDNSERDRWSMISHFVSGACYMFDRAIYTDVDEIIVLDPKVGTNPVEYILDHPDPVVAPTGIDIVHVPDQEPNDYDPTLPVLGQRRHFVHNSWYSKPAITRHAIRWGSGGHYCDQENYVIDPNLTLFHLRLFDNRQFQERRAARYSMIIDPATGKPFPNLGGKTWRTEADYLDEFRLGTIKTAEQLNAPQLNRASYKLRKVKNGIYVRSPTTKRQILRLPPEYVGLF